LNHRLAVSSGFRIKSAFLKRPAVYSARKERERHVQIQSAGRIQVVVS